MSTGFNLRNELWVVEFPRMVVMFCRHFFAPLEIMGNCFWDDLHLDLDLDHVQIVQTHNTSVCHVEAYNFSVCIEWKKFMEGTKKVKIEDGVEIRLLKWFWYGAVGF